MGFIDLSKSVLLYRF